MIPRPAKPPPVADLPHPLTFFLTGRERAAVLRALRRIHADRAVALIAVLASPATASEKSEVPTGERPHAQIQPTGRQSPRLGQARTNRSSTPPRPA